MSYCVAQAEISYFIKNGGGEYTISIARNIPRCHCGLDPQSSSPESLTHNILPKVAHQFLSPPLRPFDCLFLGIAINLSHFLMRQ